MLDTLTNPALCHSEQAPCVPLFALTGLRPGARLVVTGPDDLIRSLADMFWDRPELSGIRGTLVLRPADQDVSWDLPDDILVLEGDAGTARYAFYRVFGRMTALGMIMSRGIPHRWVA